MTNKEAARFKQIVGEYNPKHPTAFIYNWYEVLGLRPFSDYNENKYSERYKYIKVEIIDNDLKNQANNCINFAKAILSNPNTQKEYDTNLKKKLIENLKITVKNYSEVDKILDKPEEDNIYKSGYLIGLSDNEISALIIMVLKETGAKRAVESKQKKELKANDDPQRITKPDSSKLLLAKARWSITISLALFILFTILIFQLNHISIFLKIVVTVLYLPYLLLSGLYLFAYRKEIKSLRGFFDFNDFVIDRTYYYDYYDGTIIWTLSLGLGLGFIFLPIIALNFLLLALSIPIAIILSRLILKKLLLKSRLYVFLIPLISLSLFFSSYFISKSKYSINYSEKKLLVYEKINRKLPVLITTNIVNITQNAATAGGKIIEIHGKSINSKGVCWSTRPNPTLDNSNNIVLTDSLNFISRIEGLSKSTTYYVRAFALNKFGTAFGNEVSFTTDSIGIPVVSTIKVESVTTYTAVVDGIINSDGGSQIKVKGLCWSIRQEPSIDDKIMKNSTKGSSFKTKITGLEENTSYYVRAFATNSHGTGYGNIILFKTQETKFIGKNYGGGIIFYINDNGQHGFICAPSDQSRDKEWGCVYHIIGVSDLWNVNSEDIKNKGAQETAIGSGNRNTINIVKDCPDNNIAARICYNLSLNGYDDWYLPSQDELDLMYTNLKLKGLGNFEPAVYWSSSEANLNNAWAQGFVSGTQSLNGKAFTANVRAIRAF